MQPLTPNEKTKILKNQPGASPAAIEEYEALLSRRFMVPPGQPAAAPLGAKVLKTEIEGVEARLKELHAMIFGGNSEKTKL
jgi:hypothetical protein